MAYDQARGRDSGIPYVNMLTIVRNLSYTADTAQFISFLEGNLRFIYEEPSITPDATRRETEIVCLRLAGQSQKTRQGLIKDRY
jgi:hypothetical protein